jgi:hypothetical protein
LYCDITLSLNIQATNLVLESQLDRISGATKKGYLLSAQILAGLDSKLATLAHRSSVSGLRQLAVPLENGEEIEQFPRSPFHAIRSFSSLITSDAKQPVQLIQRNIKPFNSPSKDIIHMAGQNQV